MPLTSADASFRKSTTEGLTLVKASDY